MIRYRFAVQCVSRSWEKQTPKEREAVGYWARCFLNTYDGVSLADLLWDFKNMTELEREQMERGFRRTW